MTRTAQTRVLVATAFVLALTDIGVRLATFRSGGASMQRGVVTAREFRLVDAAGNPRATLSMDDGDEPGLQLFDRNGARRLQLDTWQNNPSLILFDREGNRRTFIGTDEHTGHGILTEYASDNETPATSFSLNADNGMVTPTNSTLRLNYTIVGSK